MLAEGDDTPASRELGDRLVWHVMEANELLQQALARWPLKQWI
jgi:hypothetical protein